MTDIIEKFQALGEDVKIVIYVVAGVFGSGILLTVFCLVRGCLRRRNLRQRNEKFRSLDIKIVEERRREMENNNSGKPDWMGAQPSTPSSTTNLPPPPAIKPRFFEDSAAVASSSSSSADFSYDMRPIEPPSPAIQHTTSINSVPSRGGVEIAGSRMSVRDFVAKNPQAPVFKPSAKALKMLGASETDTQKKFDGTVTERMARIAMEAAAGTYTTGGATKGLGTDIIKGFETRREKLEREKQIRDSMIVVSSSSSNTGPIKKPPPPPRDVVPNMAPGTNKLKAFMSAVPASAARISREFKRISAGREPSGESILKKKSSKGDPPLETELVADISRINTIDRPDI